jgi:NDP-sugar pyrophosphorylase family protein
MKAVVLVGGEGTRLRPLTLTTPKPLLPIANEPFIERQLAWLAQHGIDEVVLSLGYRADAFCEHFPDGRYGDLRLHYKVEDDPLGTAGAIKYAADGIDERFVVCNSDILTSLDLSAMVAFHDERGAEATISLSEVEDPSAYGVVPTRPDGRVIAFVEKPRRENAPSRWINAGTYVLEPRFLDRIPPRLKVSVERETFPRMLEQQGGLYAYKSDAYWLDIGTPERYIQANADVLEGRLAGVAACGGDAVVGAGTTVADTATLKLAALGAGVVVGEAASIARSVVMDGAQIGKGARLESSIVGPDAVVEAGTVLSDFTIVGARAVVPAASRLSAAKVAAGGRSAG